MTMDMSLKIYMLLKISVLNHCSKSMDQFIVCVWILKSPQYILCESLEEENSFTNTKSSKIVQMMREVFYIYAHSVENRATVFDGYCYCFIFAEYRLLNNFVIKLIPNYNSNATASCTASRYMRENIALWSCITDWKCGTRGRRQGFSSTVWF